MSHEKLVGRAVISWAKLENMMDKLIWAMLNQTIEVGRAITGSLDANSKMKLIRSIGILFFPKNNYSELQVTMAVLDDLREVRNLITHGTWAGTVPYGEHVALSLRSKDRPDSIVGERFSSNRMREIINSMESVITSLYSYVILAQVLNEAKTLSSSLSE